MFQYLLAAAALFSVSASAHAQSPNLRPEPPMVTTNMTTSLAPMWNRPNGPRGHLFIYVNGDAADVGIPVLMQGLVKIQVSRLRELTTRTLTSARIHLFSAGDYADGSFQAAMREVAREGGDEPINLMTLSHSHGTDVMLPTGYVELSNSFFAQIPTELKPRLRLFMNAGCWGGHAYADALKAGFAVVAGARHISLGNILLDDFLVQWLQGATVTEAAARVNWSCRNSRLWSTVFHASVGPDWDGSLANYCKDADLAVVESAPGNRALKITQLPKR